MMTSLGCHVQGAALPHSDNADPGTSEAGVRKRVFFRPPTADNQLVRGLRKFVRKYVRGNYQRLTPDTDLSVQTWLDGTDYPQWRKDELLELYGELSQEELSKLIKNKSFIKDECYGEFKHSRTINGREDASKIFIGPVIKQIESIVYQDPAFIKHVPVAKRPDYIKALYAPGDRVFVSDYSSFESLFVKSLMISCEQELLKWMVSALPNRQELTQWMESTWTGENLLVFKHFTAKVPATRMSGDMITSLCNGFSNLMFVKYLCHLKGSDCRGVVEGDDGLYYVRGEPPTVTDFEGLGLKIKLAEIQAAEVGSFCGMIFDSDEGSIICDAMKQMAKFGWGSAQYRFSSVRKRMVLLRSKSLSLAYQYQGCPILTSLAKYGLRVTKGIRIDKYLENQRNVYQREVFREMPKDEKDIIWKDVGVATRELYQRLYGVSVRDQVAIEKYLDDLDVLKPLDHPAILGNCADPWVLYYQMYVGDYYDTDPDYPFPLWRDYVDFKPEFRRKGHHHDVVAESAG